MAGSLSPERRAQPVGVGLLLALAAGGLWVARERAAEPEPPVAVVELRGDVPNPGFYALPEPAHLRDALAAAGAPTDGVQDRPLQQGDRVALGPEGAQVARTDAALALGLRLDLNAASADALETLPGVGPRKAAQIAEDRARRGPFASVDELDRVKGIGPATVEQLRPYLEVGGATPSR